MLNDQEFLDEVYYFEEDETQEKVDSIFEWIKNNPKFPVFLKEKNFNYFNLDESEYDKYKSDNSFLIFIKRLYSAFCYDIQNTINSETQKEYESYLQEIYDFCLDYLISYKIKDKEYNQLALVKFWDCRKEVSFEILKINNDLNYLIKKTKSINKYMMLKEENEWVCIENDLVLFDNPEDNFTYALVMIE